MKKISNRDDLLGLLDVALGNESLISFAVVVLGFLFGTILVLLVGRNPGGMYSAIWQAITGHNTVNGRFNVRYIGETLNYMVPFALTGLSVAFAYRTGLFNIGAEGQYVVGATVASVCAFYGPKVPFVHPLYCLVAAALFAGAYGGVVGFLKAKYEVSEVVATIMLNYMALYLSRLVMFGMPGATTFNTSDFPQTALLKADFLSRAFNGSMINMSLLVMALAAAAYWFIMEKTALGYELKATGFNRHAALASGIPTNRAIVLSMAISGAFAGLSGASVALGSFWYGRVMSGMDNYGFNGIAVALIGNCRTAGTLLAAYLFGVLKNAQALMQSRNIPKEITYIIQGVIVVFIAFRSAAVLVRDRISKFRLQKGGVR